MTIDDWRARYDGLNAEVDRLRAEVERLQADIMNVHLKRAMLVVQRDAARAWEARAVEALEAEQRAAHWRNLARITDKHEDHIEATRLSEIAQRLRHGIVLVLDRNISALDWLTQQRAEAAAEALEEFADDAVCMEKLITCNIFDLRSALRARAAALRAGATGGADA